MISKKIYEMRVKRGLRQVDLAEMLDVEQKDVSRWENGERVPSIETLVKLCECLCVSADFFLDIPDYESQRFLVIYNFTDGSYENENISVFETPYQANDEASNLWEHLTFKEKKKSHIFVVLVKKDYLDDLDDWTSYYRYDDVENGFDSDNISEID